MELSPEDIRHAKDLADDRSHEDLVEELIAHAASEVRSKRILVGSIVIPTVTLPFLLRFALKPYPHLVGLFLVLSASFAVRAVRMRQAVLREGAVMKMACQFTRETLH